MYNRTKKRIRKHPNQCLNRTPSHSRQQHRTNKTPSPTYNLHLLHQPTSNRDNTKNTTRNQRNSLLNFKYKVWQYLMVNVINSHLLYHLTSMMTRQRRVEQPATQCHIGCGHVSSHFIPH